ANEKGENRKWAQIIGFGDNKLSAMITTVLPVLPNTLRLGIRTPNGILENPLTKVYSNIVSANKQLGKILRHQTINRDINSDAGREMGKGISFDTMLSAEYDEGASTRTKAEKSMAKSASAKNAGKKVYEDLNQQIRNLIY